MKKVLIAAALTCAASSVSAATYSFEGGANPAGPFSLGCDAGGLLNVGCNVTYNAAGLGVDGIPDVFGGPGQIDSEPGTETLWVFFTSTVRLNTVTLGLFGEPGSVFGFPLPPDDDYTIAWEGSSVSGSVNPLNVGGALTSWFSVTASSSGGLFDGDIWNDEFTLKSFDISEVPLPAGLPLLVAGLGGLGLVGRRKKKAA